MRWKIIFFAIFTAAILCNYKVYSIDEVEQIDVAADNEHVEQVPNNSASSDEGDGNDKKSAELPPPPSEVKNDNDDEKDYDYRGNDDDDDQAVEVVKGAVSIVPADASDVTGSIVVAANSTAMMSGAYKMAAGGAAGEYRWLDDGYLSPLDLNDINYDWNGECIFSFLEFIKFSTKKYVSHYLYLYHINFATNTNTASTEP